ncbi:hypothetical protein CFH99_06720 [Nocardioides aromaticivorans]|uniref:Uncharacterized protein n=1 Tax=Nocardioides aromaticivorans TaxID=200618 RepID=A0ABX7PHI2_9ACTN|nr:hypothetical protein [Nocardioides aromaticivorans]QSR25314.1 hypothetical protein CFH99_06720 [Nocardioides aromaticivorans]
MQPWATRSRLPLLVDALGGTEADDAVRRLLHAFGDDPVHVTEHRVGVPATEVRRLRFASGGEIVLQDGAVLAVILHAKPPSDGAGAVDLSTWVDGLTNAATLKQVETAFGLKAQFSGFRSPYFKVGAGFAQLRFGDAGDKGSWKEPEHLVSIVVTAGQPGRVRPPDADECPACSTLPAIDEQGGLDLAATLERLRTAVAAEQVKQDPAWVPLDDLEELHASGLMRLVESQLTCRTCHRVICLTLHRDGPPTFGYHGPNEARERPMERIPPVEQWASRARQEQAREAMQYVDHRPGGWFLVRQGDALYLDARYSYSAMIDDSALIELGAVEREDYRKRGHQYLDELAERIHMSAPYQPESPYHARDLYRRGDGTGRDFRAEVGAAISNHTWLAEQRSREQ